MIDSKNVISHTATHALRVFDISTRAPARQKITLCYLSQGLADASMGSNANEDVAKNPSTALNARRAIDRRRDISPHNTWIRAVESEHVFCGLPQSIEAEHRIPRRTAVWHHPVPDHCCQYPLNAISDHGRRSSAVEHVSQLSHMAQSRLYRSRGVLCGPRLSQTPQTGQRQLWDV